MTKMLMKCGSGDINYDEEDPVLDSFSVVAIVKEDQAIVRHFCDQYVRYGAQHIYIYFDGSTKHFSRDGVFAPDGPVSLIECDPAFWQFHEGERPGRLRDRQFAVYQIAYKTCESDWLLVCDVDEFIISDVPLASWLEMVPKHIESVNFPTAEAVWGPNEDIDTAFETTLFRLPFKDASEWKRVRFSLYGPIARYMAEGLASHSHGKSITRTGIDDICAGTHEAERDGKEIAVLASDVGAGSTMVYLAHYDAISFGRWKVKFERRAPKFKEDGGTGSKKRKRQAKLANFAGRLGVGPSRMVFRMLYCLSKRQKRALEKAGLLLDKKVFH